MDKFERIIIVSIGNNVDRYSIQKNILSVQKQNLTKKFFHIIIDDGSNRNDIQCLIPKFGHVKFIQNKEQQGAKCLSYISEQIQSKNDIIILMGLQNWLADRLSIETINTYHSNGSLLTYSNGILSNSPKDMKLREENKIMTRDVLRERTYRSGKYKCGSILSFKADLWQYINVDLFKIDRHDILSCFDIPLFHMLLDMVSYKEVKNINDVVVVKNVNHIDGFYKFEQDKYFENIDDTLIYREIYFENKIGDDEINVKSANDGTLLIPIKISDYDIKKYGGK